MIPVVMSGGSGTRMWPLSRASFPKQFCQLLDESLQVKTLKRLSKLGSPWVITVKDLNVLTEKVFADLNLSNDQIIYEPFGRNTAPAIALLCKQFQLLGKEEEVVGVFPADHLVQKEEVFEKAVMAGLKYAKEGQIVTLGVKPSYPATGFGYIEVEDNPKELGAGFTVFKSPGFREKPDLKTAESFISQAKFFWNGGIFLFKVQTMAEKLKNLVPEVWSQIDKLHPDLSNLEEIYKDVPKDSIDFAVMEKLDSHICVASDFGWSDVGSWDELAKLSGSLSIPTQAQVIEEKSKNNFVLSPMVKPIALVGVNDLIVVDSDDALLICKKEYSQDVKNIVDQLKEGGQAVATEHNFDYRPWGSYQILRDDPYYKLKRVTVNPKHRLSYQSHEKRSEHWIVVEGSGEVTLNDEVIKLKTGDSIYIPKKAKHRITNPNHTPLVFVEVQTGSYFGEDDIQRYSDDYGRA